jgi:hypothetical protein
MNEIYLQYVSQLLVSTGIFKTTNAFLKRGLVIHKEFNLLFFIIVFWYVRSN